MDCYCEAATCHYETIRKSALCLCNKYSYSLQIGQGQERALLKCPMGYLGDRRNEWLWGVPLVLAFNHPLPDEAGSSPMNRVSWVEPFPAGVFSIKHALVTRTLQNRHRGN